MPDVLVITHSLPSLTGMGVSMRLGNWLEVLAKRRRVTLLVVSADPNNNEAALAPMWREVCAECHFVNVAAAAQQVPHAQLWRRVLRRVPSMWTRWPAEAVRAALPASLQGRHFAAVLVFRLRLWPVWLWLKQARGVEAGRVVLDLDDVESAAQRRQVQALGPGHFGRLGVWLERLDARRVARAEQAVLSQVDAMTLAAAADRDALAGSLQQPSHAARLHVVPNGVRLPVPLPPAPATQAFTVLFLGALDYLPNEQAVRWLVDEIVPALQRHFGAQALRIQVVGRNPPAWMKQAQGIELHPDVPRVEPYFAGCHVLVVPLRMGGGTRIKIIEALAYGRPVVSTAVGAEGLGLQAGQHALMAETTNEFVQAVAQLQAQAALALRLADAGCRHVQQNFSLDAVARAALVLFDPS